MEKIKDNEYIRTKQGTIAKIKDSEFDIRFIMPDCKTTYRNWKKDFSVDRVTYEEIVKHSFNLTDLIEKDDYVNGYKVESLDDEFGNEILGFYRYDDDVIIGIIPLEGVVINNVVTKEQFKNVMYEV